MADFYLRNSSATERANSTAYLLGDKVVVARADAQANFAVMRRYVFEATVAGTSGAAVPVYPVVVANTVVDGTVTWTCRECDSWINANKYIDYVASRLAINDTLLVSQAHSETSAVSTTAAFAGTFSGPNRVVCVNDTNGAPAITATVSSSGNASINITGSYIMYGVTFFVGVGGTGAPSINLAGGVNNVMVYESCSAQASATGNTVLNFGATRTDVQKIHLRNFTFKFSAALQRIIISANMKIDGGSVLAGGTTPTNVFHLVTNAVGIATVSGTDFSNLGTGFNLLSNNGALGTGLVKFVGVTLPTGWIGSLWNANPLVPGQRAELINARVGTGKIGYWAWDLAGQVRDNQAIYRTSGAVDDAVPFSIKMSTTADSKYPVVPLESNPMKVYVNTSGASVTLSVEVLHDSQGSGTGGLLTDADIGAKVSLSGILKDTMKVSVTSASVDFPTSTAAWTVTGMTTPLKQKISLTFTPLAKGEAAFSVLLFAASKTVYICPKLGG